MPGVNVVRDGDFVGVAAPDEPTAARGPGRDPGRVERRRRSPSDKDLFDYLKEHPSRGSGGSGGPRGRRARLGRGRARPRPTSKLEATYTVAYIAHAPLEPRAAVAEWEDGKLTVWTGTQRPFGVRGELAQAFDLPEDQVRVIVPDTGAGYGGKHTGEAAVEAARLAQGRGQAGQAGLDARGRVHLGLLPPRRRDRGRRPASTRTARSPPGSSTTTTPAARASRTPYEVAEPAGRSSMRRDVAAAAGLVPRPGGHGQPLRPRVAHGRAGPRRWASTRSRSACKNLKDARLRAVLEAAAEQFGWGKSKPGDGPRLRHRRRHREGRLRRHLRRGRRRPATGRGQGRPRRDRRSSAARSSTPTTSETRSRARSSMGLGGALFEAIEFDDGKILNPRFSRYRVPRFGDMPADRGRAARPQGPALRRRRRDADRRHRPGRRQRHLQRHGRPAAVDAAGTEEERSRSERLLNREGEAPAERSCTE